MTVALSVSFQSRNTFSIACDADYASGCTNLGKMHEMGLGTHKDAQKAVWFYQEACMMHDAESCAQLGSLYESGRGVLQDKALASRHYKNGCDSGDARSCRSWMALL